jgi:hypothetical protein
MLHGRGNNMPSEQRAGHATLLGPKERPRLRPYEEANKRTIPEAPLEGLRDGLSLNYTRTTGPPDGDG